MWKTTIRKYDLLRSGVGIVRVLDIQNDKVLIIDCIKRTMPVWVNLSTLDSYAICSIETLNEATGRVVPVVAELDAEQKRVMRIRYTHIAPILPFVGNQITRARLIASIAEKNNLSKKTIQRNLCLYLTYMDVAALAPENRRCKDETLTQDEKNIRWALNKFFYTTRRLSLDYAYTMMLKEKYCDSRGVLDENHPTFHQFRYFYRKTKKMQNYYISRDGLTHYQRNNRPLLGEGVRQFAPAVGVGMLDSTICDVHLRDEAGRLLGRPILTVCIDAYSSLCCGYALSWEGGMYSLRKLMAHIVADKTAWCERFGIAIREEDWDCRELPATLVTDRGREYLSENLEQISELGVEIVNLPAYRPELKGTVEKFFDLVQRLYKNHLKGKGVIEPDYQERGARDYRLDAVLTMTDFERIMIHCIVYYNSQRIIQNFPYTEEMLAERVQPYASCVWNWGKKQPGANLIDADERRLTLTLLPRTTGKFSRRGLQVNKMRYYREDYTERYLRGGEATVAYNPENVSSVWLLENGAYVEFAMVDSRYEGKDLLSVQKLQTERKAVVREAERDNLQARIDPARHIEIIADGAVMKRGSNTDMEKNAPGMGLENETDDAET